MPSLEDYRLYYSGDTIGEMHKYSSDSVIEDRWDGDIETRTVYFYDYYHDDRKTELIDMQSDCCDEKVPVSVKYIPYSQQTYAKDIVTYHIQFKPSYENTVDYYDDCFKDRYGATFPTGLYCDIPDNKGKFNRWLVVAGANYYDTQFSTYEILPCDYVFQWVYNGMKYEVPGVLRSQNSYNSGVWTDFKFTNPEDQQKFILPLNRETENIYYNQRFIVDAKVLSEPRAWVVTKVNRLSAKGVVHVTLAQDKFDNIHDYILVDETGNVVGMWANYYDYPVQPDEYDEDKIVYEKISFSGLNPQLKINGGYKKFTIESVDSLSGDMSFTIDGNDASGLVSTLKSDQSTELLQNQIKIKFTGNEDYINKILKILYTEQYLYAELDVSIVSL